MTIHKAERLVAALAVSARAQAQNAFKEPFDSPETVYRSCLDMRAFQQEVLRVVLVDARFRRIPGFKMTPDDRLAEMAPLCVVKRFE